MKTTYLLCILLLFTSSIALASENKISVSSEKTNTYQEISTKKTLKVRKKKLNFKERMALRIIKRKIKKQQKKLFKPRQNKSRIGDASILGILGVLLMLLGIIGGIIYLVMGKVALGIGLLLFGILGIPLIIALVFIVALLT